MLERAAARDATYDGRFITGVLSTGIYCLPSCSARKPRPENVRFFHTPAKAEAAGLRACLRCRPDLFYAGEHPERDRIAQLVERMREEPAEYADTRALARAAGVGPTKLNELFRQHYHVSPSIELQRARVRRACQLLIGTRRRVLDVALDSGFESTSAFHENFRRITGLSPTGYRRLRDSRRFVVALPDDFRVAETIDYLSRHAESPTEWTSGRTVGRALVVEGRPLEIVVEFAAGRARCRVEAARPVGPEGMATIHAAVQRWLGLTVDPAPFEQSVQRKRPWRHLVAARQGLRIPQTPTVFEGFAWAIVGQQVNLPFARTLRRRLIELVGSPTLNGLRGHPSADEVAALDYADLTARQYSRRKAEYLIDGARSVVEGRLALEDFPKRAASAVEEELLAVRGIGVWSANYLMMRACGFADCVPVGDSGLRAALKRFLDLDDAPDGDRVRELMAPLAPHRSLATFHLWMILGESA